MGIVTTGQWGPYEARLQVKAKRQAVQWIDGPDNTVSNSVGDEDLGVKPGEDVSVGRRGARPVQRLGGDGDVTFFVPVLGGNGTRIAPTGDIFDQPLGQM